MNKTQQKFRQQRARQTRKAARNGEAPPVVGQVAPGMHQATKPLSPELDAAIGQAMKAGPALVFIVQHDEKAGKVHCYRFESNRALHGQQWPHSEDAEAEGLVMGLFARMRAGPVQPAQAPTTSGW